MAKKIADVTIKASVLLNLIEKVGGAVSTSNVNPIMKSVKLDFFDYGVIATGGDGNVFVSSSLVIDLNFKRSMLFDYFFLHLFLRNLGDVEMEMYFEKSTCKCKVKELQGEYYLPIQEATGYIFENPNYNIEDCIDGGVLKRSVSSVAFAADKKGKIGRASCRERV